MSGGVERNIKRGFLTESNLFIKNFKMKLHLTCKETQKDLKLEDIFKTIVTRSVWVEQDGNLVKKSQDGGYCPDCSEFVQYNPILSKMIMLFERFLSERGSFDDYVRVDRRVDRLFLQDIAEPQLLDCPKYHSVGMGIVATMTTEIVCPQCHKRATKFMSNTVLTEFTDFYFRSKQEYFKNPLAFSILTLDNMESTWICCTSEEPPAEDNNTLKFAAKQSKQPILWLDLIFKNDSYEIQITLVDQGTLKLFREYLAKFKVNYSFDNQTVSIKMLNRKKCEFLMGLLIASNRFDDMGPRAVESFFKNKEHMKRRDGISILKEKS